MNEGWVKMNKLGSGLLNLQTDKNNLKRKQLKTVPQLVKRVPQLVKI